MEEIGFIGRYIALSLAVTSILFIVSAVVIVAIEG